jgi:hypothetical protein
VRKLIKIALVALGIRAFLRWRKSRKESQATGATAEPAADPAHELRQKLAESREDETAIEVEEPPSQTVAERRAGVHEEGRAALDEMSPTNED